MICHCLDGDQVVVLFVAIAIIALVLLIILVR